jgi:hypothetical protein
MKIITYIVCLIICCISCNEKKIDHNQFSKSNDKLILKFNLDSINIDFIKEMGKEFSTSTYLSKNEYIYYPQLKDKEYFGFYHLFYKDTCNKIKCIGNMIISNSDIPWKYENKSDKLVELLIVDKNIALFKNISVGNSVDILKPVFGNPIWKIKEIIIFKLSENEYLSAKSMNKKIAAIKIGKYSTTLSDSLLIKKLSDFSY